MASPRKSERLISSRGHGCFTISPPQLPATATRFPSHGSGRPGLVLRTATKLSSVGFEPTAVLTFGLRVRRLNHWATCSLRNFFRNTLTCETIGRSVAASLNHGIPQWYVGWFDGFIERKILLWHFILRR